MSKETIKLDAASRDVKAEKANILRSKGLIPAVIYGHGVKNRTLKVKAVEFNKAFSHAGETHLINLTIDQEAPVKVLVYGVERDGIKEKVENIDFLQVNMKEKITVEVPLVYVGESKAVRELGGVLIKTTDHLEVECLPDDLVDTIEIDLSVLENIGDQLKMSDIKLPNGLELTSDTNEPIVSIVGKEEEVEPVVEAAPVEPAAVKVDEKKEEKK